MWTTKCPSENKIKSQKMVNSRNPAFLKFMRSKPYKFEIKKSFWFIFKFSIFFRPLFDFIFDLFSTLFSTIFRPHFRPFFNLIFDHFRPYFRPFFNLFRPFISILDNSMYSNFRPFLVKPRIIVFCASINFRFLSKITEKLPKITEFFCRTILDFWPKLAFTIFFTKNIELQFFTKCSVSYP